MQREPRDGVWRPSGLVTLLTDFGGRDPYVGIMKGVLLGRAPSLRAVIDLTHDVPPQDLEVAAFHLAHALPWFPSGTVHVVVVDPGVGTGREILVVECAGHVVLAPDNGIVGPLLEGHPDAIVRRLDPALAPVVGASTTFHGRDRFAPAAALLGTGRAPRELGERVTEFHRLSLGSAERCGDGTVVAHVLFVDHFGNLLTDATPADLGGDPSRWTAEVAGRPAPVVETYGRAAPGELVALVSSFGTLEVAVRNGCAARELGLGKGDTIRFLAASGRTER